MSLWGVLTEKHRPSHSGFAGRHESRDVREAPGMARGEGEHKMHLDGRRLPVQLGGKPAWMGSPAHLRRASRKNGCAPRALASEATRSADAAAAGT